MKKHDIVCKVAKEMEMKQIKVQQVIQMVLDGIVNIIATEKRLELRDFGVFDVQTRKPRKARNPKTGEEVMIPARDVVRFRASKLLIQKVRGLVEAEDWSQEEEQDEGF